MKYEPILVQTYSGNLSLTKKEEGKNSFFLFPDRGTYTTLIREILAFKKKDKNGEPLFVGQLSLRQ